MAEELIKRLEALARGLASDWANGTIRAEATAIVAELDKAKEADRREKLLPLARELAAQGYEGGNKGNRTTMSEGIRAGREGYARVRVEQTLFLLLNLEVDPAVVFGKLIRGEEPRA